MAVLIYLEKTEEHDLEVLTCTSVEQQWGGLQEETLKKFDAVPLKDFCHINKPPPPYKRTILPVTKEMEEEFRAMFIADQPESEAAIFLSGTRERPLPTPQNTEDLSSVLDYIMSPVNAHYLLKRTAELTQSFLSLCSDEEKKYYKQHVALSPAETKELCLATLNQDNDTWDRLRSNRFTGTRIYPTYTYSKNKKADWKKRFQSMFCGDFDGNADTDRGLLYEGDSRDRYTAQKCSSDERMLLCGVVIQPSAPWLGYSPDGLVCKEGKTLRLFETKCPRPGETKPAAEAAELVSYRKNGNLCKAHKYYGQIQLGMLMTHTTSCDFTIYSSKCDDIFSECVMLDDHFLLDMLERTVNVYFTKCLPWLVAAKAQCSKNVIQGVKNAAKTTKGRKKVAK